MEEKINLQHTQVPNEMGKANLTPTDQYVYAILKTYQNKQTKLAFPSLKEVAAKANLSIPTVRNSITHLEKEDYIKVEVRGRKNFYHFNEYKKFEPFSPEFLERNDLSATTKAYLVASQQYMYKDVENYGKIGLSNYELARQINMPEATIRKCNNELESKDYLTIIKNENRDLQTGCQTETKLIQLSKLGQAIVWAVCNHEERIQQNTQDIDFLKKQILEQQKLIEALLQREAAREKAQSQFPF